MTSILFHSRINEVDKYHGTILSFFFWNKNSNLSQTLQLHQNQGVKNNTINEIIATIFGNRGIERKKYDDDIIIFTTTFIFFIRSILSSNYDAKFLFLKCFSKTLPSKSQISVKTCIDILIPYTAILTIKQV